MQQIWCEFLLQNKKRNKIKWNETKWNDMEMKKQQQSETITYPPQKVRRINKQMENEKILCADIHDGLCVRVYVLPGYRRAHR